MSLVGDRGDSALRSDAPTGRALWQARVAATPQSPFLLAAGQTWTYAEADARMRRLAAGLRARGVGFLTRLLVGTENTADGVLLHIAARELGAVLVPLLPGLTFDELAYQVRDSAGQLLVCDGRVADALLPRIGELDDLPIATADELLDHDPLAVELLDALTPATPSAIMYTSGSTARPKGVVLPAGGFFNSGRGYQRRFAIGPQDVYLLPLTIAHGVGGTCAQSMVMHAGAALALVDRFSPSSFWAQSEAVGATCTLLFPAQMNLLLMTATDAVPRSSTMRLVITHTWSQAFHERFGTDLGLVWASTECGSVGAGSDPGYRGTDGSSYVGRPFDDIEIRIVDGRIRLRQPYSMVEYLGQPELTAAVRDADGWIHTGDLGRFDADGALHFLGRDGSMIKRSGENISPAEVQLAVAEHPAVLECFVLGVADPVRTQEVAAFVVVDDAASATAGEIAAFAAEGLARWKAPRYVVIATELLPRLSSGKVDARTLRERFDPAAAWDREADQLPPRLGEAPTEPGERLP